MTASTTYESINLILLLSEVQATADALGRIGTVLQCGTTVHSTHTRAATGVKRTVTAMTGDPREAVQALLNSNEFLEREMEERVSRGHISRVRHGRFNTYSGQARGQSQGPLMQRDMEIIRTLLLKLEALPIRSDGVILISGTEGHSADEVNYHLRLLREHELIECLGSITLSGGLPFRRLTWQGHDFIDAVRDPEIWDYGDSALNSRTCRHWSLELSALSP